MLHCGVNVRTRALRGNLNGHALAAAEGYAKRVAGAMVCVKIGSGRSQR
jgi:hypothetical protein